jgi:hypothetical protein
VLSEVAILGPPIQRPDRVGHRSHAAARQRRAELVDDRLDVATADADDPLGAEGGLNVDAQDLLVSSIDRGL